jgi:hypothetical protein
VEPPDAPQRPIRARPAVQRIKRVGLLIEEVKCDNGRRTTDLPDGCVDGLRATGLDSRTSFCSRAAVGQERGLMLPNRLDAARVGAAVDRTRVSVSSRLRPTNAS